MRRGSPGISHVKTSTAHAQCDASCSAGPIELSGPSEVVTAETDPAQLIGGLTPGHADGQQWDELAKGPLVVTDLMVTDYSDARLGIADPGKCDTGKVLATSINLLGLNGAHLLIPKGKVLCGAGGEARWAGFRPYE